MMNEVCQWNPDVDPMVAGRWLNNYLRQVIDKRQWYGLKVRGTVSIANVINAGTATVTNGSTNVTGVGTAWNPSMNGLQFRVGFTYPYQTIVNVVNSTTLTLDTPFGGTTTTGGYTIVEAYATLGANIKYLLWAVNQQQGWPMEVNVPVETLNEWDVWRQSLGWSTVFATRPPTPDGQFQIEIWPTPYGNQVFPFEAYTQPADMFLDSDCPPPFIRADLLVTRAIADAKLFGGRASKYYDPTVAQMKITEYNVALEAMENADNMFDQRDVTWEYGQEEGRVGFGPGSTWAQSHDV